MKLKNTLIIVVSKSENLVTTAPNFLETINVMKPGTKRVRIVIMSVTPGGPSNKSLLFSGFDYTHFGVRGSRLGEGIS
jgi:hypothetical protein